MTFDGPYCRQKMATHEPQQAEEANIQLKAKERHRSVHTATKSLSSLGTLCNVLIVEFPAGRSIIYFFSRRMSLYVDFLIK